MIKKQLRRVYGIGALIKKCSCRKKPCVCGSHGPILVNPKAHRIFVEAIFAA
jgi:hypothetical protein